MQQFITSEQAYTHFWLGDSIYYRDFGFIYLVECYAELASVIEDHIDLFILVD